MRIIEIDGELDPDVIELLEVSGKLRTKEQIVREIVLEAIDPINAFGPEFIFESRPNDDPMYLSLEVPDFGDQVDLAHAWTIAQLDAKAAALILDRDNSLAATLRVLRNQHQWFAFWASRFPHDGWRQRFATQLAERQEALEALKMKAGCHFRLEVLNELKAI